MKVRDHLEKQSLILIAAAMIGHAGNYVYHVITGRALSAKEYGLLMALFGMINLFLIPMSALSLVLARRVALQIRDPERQGIRTFFKRWAAGMALAGLGFLLLARAAASPLQRMLDFDRTAPLMIAALIPGLNLFLTLTGALLQGFQHFKALALRGALLFSTRALLVGGCLYFGWRAAGWALLAHVLGMAGALILSLAFLRTRLQAPDAGEAPPAGPLLRDALHSVPLLLAFSTLMTADVILAKRYFDPLVAGQFAQAATLGRMILWLPLPIAQVMFPKVVHEGSARPEQRRTLFKALAYTLLLILLTLTAGWFAAPLLLKAVYGLEALPPGQLQWFRSTAIAMALLGPVYMLLQYELARGKIRRMLPLCLLAPLFPLGAHYLHQSPQQLLSLLIGLNAAALLSCLPALRKQA